MKRALSLFTVLAVLVCSAPSFASVEKLKSGATAVVTSPLQIRDAAMDETKDAKFLPFALVGGLLKGTFYMGKQIVGGVIDIVTFPIDK